MIVCCKPRGNLGKPDCDSIRLRHCVCYLRGFWQSYAQTAGNSERIANPKNNRKRRKHPTTQASRDTRTPESVFLSPKTNPGFRVQPWARVYQRPGNEHRFRVCPGPGSGSQARVCPGLRAEPGISGSPGVPGSQRYPLYVTE